VSFRSRALLGDFITTVVGLKVFGTHSLKRNILDAYKFICRNYDRGPNSSKLHLFGFSRGAFTARVLAAFILER
jgi:uncharacterized protein (DUF2235 family)